MVKTYICEICGDAYIGADIPSECPFCGARNNFIKNGSAARPVFDRGDELSPETQKRMRQTYDLEVRAVAIYNCMAEKAKGYETKAMYKRLSKVEMEHATIATKFLKIDRPTISEEPCSDDEIENFKKTIELENHATELYAGFAKESQEESAKIFFAALAGAEASHIQLINNYL